MSFELDQLVNEIKLQVNKQQEWCPYCKQFFLADQPVCSCEDEMLGVVKQFAQVEVMRRMLVQRFTDFNAKLPKMKHANFIYEENGKKWLIQHDPNRVRILGTHQNPAREKFDQYHLCYTHEGLVFLDKDQGFVYSDKERFESFLVENQRNILEKIPLFLVQIKKKMEIHAIHYFQSLKNLQGVSTKLSAQLLQLESLETLLAELELKKMYGNEDDDKVEWTFFGKLRRFFRLRPVSNRSARKKRSKKKQPVEEEELSLDSLFG